MRSSVRSFQRSKFDAHYAEESEKGRKPLLATDEGDDPEELRVKRNRPWRSDGSGDEQHDGAGAVGSTCCHATFLWISFYSCASLLALLGSQFGLLLFNKVWGLRLILRCYNGVFCACLLWVEFSDGSTAGAGSPMRSNWILRGLAHSYLGLVNEEERTERACLTYERDVGNASSSSTATATIQSAVEENFLVFQQVSSWMMIVSGCLYFLMGLCCLDRLKRSHAERHRSVVEDAEYRSRIVDEELERRRH